MSFVASVCTHRLDLSLVVMAVVGLGINAVSAGEGGRVIEFSSSDDSSVSTNVSQFSSKQVQDELMKRRFKEDFSKSFESGYGSLDAVMVPSVHSPSLSPA